jgi:thiamine biosynthesis protein ThiI
LCTLSGGIDSPVAMKLAKRWFDVVPVHFLITEFYPLDYVERFVEMLKVFKERIRFKKLLVFPFSNVLRKIVELGPRKYRCVLCRKSMLKACEFLCDKHNFQAIVTGEAIGQKASQTIYNLAATSYGIKYPILHPLLCFDKQEIEKLARRFNLFTQIHIGHCLMVPKYPITRGRKKVVERIFEKIGVAKVIEENLDKVVEIRKPEELLMVIE